jgi:carbon storage regulator
LPARIALAKNALAFIMPIMPVEIDSNAGRNPARRESFPDKEEKAMLVLSRKMGEGIVLGRDLEVVVLEIRGKRVRLGVSGPAETPIHRGEVYRRIAAEPPALDQAECA